MGDIIWIILLLVMAWFLFARPRDDADDGSGSDDSTTPPRRDGRPSPGDLRPPSRYQAPPAAPGSASGPESPDTEPTPREASEAYRRAQAMWDSLRSAPSPRNGDTAAASRKAGSQGFDPEEFLQGARMVYARIQESWDARDLADIREFVDDQVFNNLQALAAKDPAPSHATILTLDAAFLDIEPERDREVASVRFRVRMSKNDKPPYTIEEIWHFGRELSAEGAPLGMWKVVGISQVA
ncbi:Tim44 domain-containing protein [Megalodesulfovibrio gigas]|uniref:Putative import inner membrane translocase subunit Tim44 n=1 Tax=Megalodesulfovibrio gigas (strain ATCC 19364 / DSM 1382 / NCIMB 9332 / VKM B-1759) TaxID=1121448 RepID=T2G854_MEGG1|nr:Tim44 domain-containing protein [Megalodesulfovibrio gigas]AGW12326.1 putative import inner membrane translocase subunit Tim44 [Megalodesulfovibrio gigas DSM 1382 = ATCC 19364]